ncbi:MAG: hypothetical protein Q4A58_00750 [Fusobacterium sp.]|nr:hypothetical protein [Fusobacterium sp.]MDO4689810.1 hypothetical protein [Fusobacterium sp.]
MKDKFLDELRNFKIGQIKEELGIVDEGNIVSEEDLEGDTDE